jgi:hypothetical protein
MSVDGPLAAATVDGLYVRYWGLNCRASASVGVATYGPFVDIRFVEAGGRKGPRKFQFASRGGPIMVLRGQNQTMGPAHALAPTLPSTPSSRLDLRAALFRPLCLAR